VIEIHLFGHLREYATDPLPGPGTVVRIANSENRTVGQMLSELGIEPAKVGNLFLNGRLLPRSTYPMLLGYPLAASETLTVEEYLDTRIKEGDRVGIFPRDMSSVVV
jgi:hypothetical protein